MNIFSKGSNFDSKGEEKKKKLGETKGDNGFRGDLGGGQVNIG